MSTYTLRFDVPVYVTVEHAEDDETGETYLDVTSVNVYDEADTNVVWSEVEVDGRTGVVDLTDENHPLRQELEAALQDSDWPAWEFGF